MAVKNNYWKKVLSKLPRFYCAGGLEIHLVSDEYYDHRTNTFKQDKLRVCMPSSASREERRIFNRKLAMDKRIAQSVTTKEEYNKLWARIDEENWDFIEREDLKDTDLIHWAYNTRTADEFYRLLRYN